jgi:hypothetical protein
MTSSINNHPIVLDRPNPDTSTASTDLSFDLTQAVSPDALEHNADHLMDAVFADVERMLERGTSLPVEASTEVAEVAAPVSQPVVPLDSILPPKLSPRDLMPPSADPSVELATAETSEQEALGLSTAASNEAKKSNTLLWLAVLCSSMLVSAAILSYLFREQLTQIWLHVLNGKGAQPTVVSASPTTEASEQDTDFLKYIQRSLDRLASQTNSDSQVATQPSPTITISPAPSPTVVERVYVPVYPSPTTASPGTVTVSPAASSNPANVSRPVPNVATNSSPAVAPTSIPNITAATHTLIGVLALGERSAALFEIDGTPQRIEIGGQIGSSGWTLVSINNQEAIVRKNGEVRSIYVGQKF